MEPPVPAPSSPDEKPAGTSRDDEIVPEDKLQQGGNAFEEAADEFQRELQEGRKKFEDDLNSLRKLTIFVTPSYLRGLFDLTMQKVLHDLGYASWADLHDGRRPKDMDETADFIFQGLVDTPRRPSRDAIRLFCTYAGVRRDSKEFAVEATQAKITEGLLGDELFPPEEQLYLAELFFFVYDTELPKI